MPVTGPSGERMSSTSIAALSVAPVLVVGGSCAIAVALRRRSGHARTRGLLAVALAALAFQVLHVAEHLLQVAHWVVLPSQGAWLTPWAAAGRDALAAVADGRAGTGGELLHLLGNALFLAGLLVLGRLVAHRAPAGDGPAHLRRATVTQVLHVLEHVALTVTWVLAGEANGVSTAFGLLDAGTTVGVATRVWLHFGINLLATVQALRAVRHLDVVTWLREVVAAARAERDVLVG